jgi:hypothetical protein
MAPQVKMTVDERRKYLRIMQGRYLAAGRARKSALLDEMAEVTSMHRKSLTRLLHSDLKRHQRQRERGAKYGPEVEEALALIGKALDYVCAERLYGGLLSTAKLLAHHAALALSPQLRHKLEEISLSSVRRHAPGPADAPDRVARPQRRTQTRWQQELPAGRIAWDIAEPGHFEVDVVHHCGAKAQGEYVYTLQLIDVATGWSERGAILGRSHIVMADAFETLLQRLPFPVRELHPDNGSEFLNDYVIPFLRARYPHLALSRSRPYRKNDNPHVEQKHRTLVRDFLGDWRFDTVQQTRYLKRLYEVMGPYYNFIQPVLHLVEKEWIPATAQQAAHLHRKHDRARPPLERLCETDVLTAEQQADLRAQRLAINPLALRERIYQMIQHLLSYPGAKPGEVQNAYQTLSQPELFSEAIATLADE